jgi:hypothetical protein
MNIWGQYRRVLWGVIFVLVVALNVWFYTQQQMNEWWWYTNHDALRIASMYQSLTYPDTFSQDFLFRNGEYFRFYTPSFFTLMSLFANGIDTMRPFAPITALILLIYVPIATLLFWIVSRRWAIALIMAMVSTMGFGVIQEFWQLTDLYSALPRSVAMPFIMLAVSGMFGAQRLKDTRHIISLYALTGLCVGVVANLHPASGIGIAIIIFGMSVLWYIRHKKPSILAIAIFTVGVGLAALPIITTVAGNSSFGTVGATRDWSQLWIYASYLLAGRNLTQVFPLLGAVWLLLSLLAWFRAKPNNLWQCVFCIAQAIYGMLLIPEFHVLLIGCGVAFVIYRYRQQTLNQLFSYFEWLGWVIIACQLVPFVAFLIMPNQNSALIWMLELMRIVRVISLPFFAVIAVVLSEQRENQTVSDQQLWIGAGILALLFEWILVVPLVGLWAMQRFGNWLKYTWLRILWMSAVVSIGTLIILRSVLALYFGYCVIIAIIAGVMALAVQVLAPYLKLSTRVQQTIVFFTPLACLVISALLRQNPTQLHKILVEQLLFSSALALLMAGIIVFIYSGRVMLMRNMAGAFLAILVLQTSLAIFYRRDHFFTIIVPAHIQAAEWARANTSPDNLFYMVNQASLDSEIPMEFRIESLRSISHNLNEMNLVSYAIPQKQETFDKRHAEQIASYQNAESLIAMAQQYKADYIFVDTNFLGYTLDLPIVFSLENIIIYALASQ